jgi:hypothetical protein
MPDARATRPRQTSPVAPPSVKAIERTERMVARCAAVACSFIHACSNGSAMPRPISCNRKPINATGKPVAIPAIPRHNARHA